MEMAKVVAMQSKEEKEDAISAMESWTIAMGFSKLAAVRCAVELGIADVIHNHGGAATLPQLSAAIGCTQPHSLRRVMRFLVHHGIFKTAPATTAPPTYSLTPFSRRLLKGGDPKSMADLILLESSAVMLAPWLGLSKKVLAAGEGSPPFVAAHGTDIWGYTAANSGHSKLVDDAMACDARLGMTAIVGSCPEVFEGVGTVVDVGGGNGTAMAMLVKSFPEIRAINFDLPHVVAAAPEWAGVEHVSGDMFKSVPEADVVFLMKVLHDWPDSECIQILKKCREAIVAEDSSSVSRAGKVMIVDAVIEEEEEDDDSKAEKEFSWTGVKLGLDMVMMAHTSDGKERTRSEWAHVLNQSGFHRFTIINPTSTFHSVIQAFPN